MPRPRCQHDNPPGHKFCGECAALVARRCSNCGAEVGPTAKFCSECAHPTGVAGTTPTTRFAAPESYTPRYLAERILTSKPALEGERKQVTVLFADMKGSMELLADRDPEEALHHVVQIPRAQWGATTVAQAMIPAARMRSACPDTDLRAALEAMDRDGVSQLPVMVADHAVGILRREDILGFLRAARQLRGRA